MIFNEKYQINAIINNGAFGIIFKVVEIGTNNYYLLKFISIFEKSEEEKNQIKEDYNRESVVMKDIKNKYVIKYKENFFD